MPASGGQTLPLESAWPTSDPERDHEQLRRVARMLTWLPGSIAIGVAIAAIWSGERELLGVAFVLVAFVGWIRWAGPRAARHGGRWFAVQAAVVMLLAV